MSTYGNTSINNTSCSEQHYRRDFTRPVCGVHCYQNMFNTCFQCGEFRADKVIDPSGQVAICPVCGYEHPIKRLPLFLLAGASGTGKSTIAHRLIHKLTGIVIIETDILGYAIRVNGTAEVANLWLRVCKNISQGGQPVLLEGGLFPDECEQSVERRYFSAVHYIVLVCNDEVIEERLAQRPAWRQSSKPEFIAKHLRRNRRFKSWLSQKTACSVTSIDTTDFPIEEAVTYIERFVWEQLRSSPPSQQVLRN